MTTAQQKPISKKEKKRRAAQSARDKAAAARVTKQAAPHRREPKPPHVRNVRKTYSSQGRTLNRLAMSMATPQFTQPIRLPTVNRSKTDVKKLWFTDSLLLDQSAGTTGYAGGGDVSSPAYVGSRIGSLSAAVELPKSFAFFALSRDPVVTGYQSKFKTFASNTGFSGVWQFIWPDATPVPENPLLSPSAGYSQPFKTTINEGVPAGATSQIRLSTLNSAMDPFTVVFNSSSPQPGHVPVMRANGRFYAYHPAGRLCVAVALSTLIGPSSTPAAATTVPTDCQLVLSFVLRRLVADDAEDETDEFDVTIPENTSAVQHFVNAPTGYYCIDPVTSTFENNSTVMVDPDGTWGQIRVSSEYLNSTSVPQFTNMIFPMVNTDMYSAQYLLEKCRLNSSAMLVSNTSSALLKSGTIYGCRLLGRNSLWTHTSLAEIKAAAGSFATGYRGPAEKGIYTFMEPDDRLFTLNDHTMLLNNGVHALNVTQWPYSRTDMSTAHVILVEIPTTTGTLGGSWSLSVRVDSHLEYFSNSMLANLGISGDPVEDYTNATIALSAGCYFFENPTHMRQIWDWIIQTGKAAIMAGASVAARTALERAAVALGTLTL